MTTRRSAALGVAVSAAALLLVSTRTWVTGRTTDPVLGGAQVAATGSQAAPAAVAFGAVCLAALVVTLTAAPRTRVGAIVLLVASALGAGYAVTRVLLEPASALSARAAEQAGRSGLVSVTVTVTGWLWCGLICAVGLLVTSAWLVLAVRGTGGLSGRFDRAGAPVEGRQPARSNWDALSDGDDPTDGPPVGGWHNGR